MNMSRAISQLKLQLGLYAITLPFKDGVSGETIPTENVLHDVLTTTTIPTYSQFKPWMRTHIERKNNLKCIDRVNHIFLLPAFLTMTPVMYVSDVSLAANPNYGFYNELTYGISQSVQGVLTGNASLMVSSQLRAEPSFEYLGENKVALYGWPNVQLRFTVACEHEPNGETIPDSCYDSFMELATLDVKTFLYNTLKMYDGIPTAFGQIQLKIESFEAADGERKELLERWRDTFHLDMDDWTKYM